MMTGMFARVEVAPASLQHRESQAPVGENVAPAVQVFDRLRELDLGAVQIAGHRQRFGEPGLSVEAELMRVGCDALG